MLTHAGRYTASTIKRESTRTASRLPLILVSSLGTYSNLQLGNRSTKSNAQNPRVLGNPPFARALANMSAPKLQNLRASLENGIALLKYDIPKANALSAQTMKDLISGLSWAFENPEVKVVVLSGEGKFFTAGLDLTNVPAEGPVLPDASIEMLRQIHKLLINASKVTIAGVNGSAVGWGVTSIALFDLVYSVPDAVFMTPFLKVGLCAEACSSITFRKIMGRQKAFSLLLAGEQMTAQELENAGLITKFFAKEGFLDEVMKIANRIAAHPSGALEANKQLLMEPMREELLAANERECKLLHERGKTDEPRKAIEAFAREQEQKKKSSKL